MIDLSTVQIHNSPDVHAWPASTAISRLELRPSGVHVEFTKKDGPDRWPDFPFGDPSEHGNLQYTLWILLKIAEAWHAAGCIEFWHGLDENGGPVDEYAKNWYYDPNRWAPMSGHQPAPGELVGFLITSGDARHSDAQVGLHERSNIVTVAFPTAAGGVFTFGPEEVPETSVPVLQPPAPPSPAPPSPAPPSTIDPVSVSPELLHAYEQLERLVDAVEQLARSAMALEGPIQQIASGGVRLHW
jgi:hypothetical protein